VIEIVVIAVVLLVSAVVGVLVGALGEAGIAALRQRRPLP